MRLETPQQDHAEARTTPQVLGRVAGLMRRLPPRWRRPALLAVLALAVPLALVCSYAFDRALTVKRVGRGVWVGRLAASGLERSVAERAIAELGARLRARRLPVQVAQRLFWLDPREVGFAIDVPRTFESAFEVGRTEGVGAQLVSWLGRLAAPLDVGATATLDAALLDRLLLRWEAEALREAPFEGAVRIDGTSVRAEYPRAGLRLDRQAARRALLAGVIEDGAQIVVLPTAKSEPRLTRAQIDRAVARARAVIAEPIELVDEAQGEVVRLEPDVLRAALTSQLGDDPRQGLVLGLDPVRIEPALGAARARLERAPRNARFVIDGYNRISVEASGPGSRIDALRVAEAALVAASKPDRRAPLPVEHDLFPTFTTEQAHALGIRKMVGRFSTHHVCCQPRVHNIHRIAELMNDVIVRPGETLSVNAVVGQRTQKNGFILAPGIEEGEMVDTLGGGVSQFATTLFNAVFHAGYDIIERQAHSYWFPRYPMGHEATLSWPKPDLIFKNDTASGLVIKTEYTDTRITVTLYGDNADRTVRAEVSHRREITDPPEELLPNPELLPYERKVQERGLVGWSVLVSRVIRNPDGTEKRESRKVTYKPRPRRVEVHPCMIPRGQPGPTGESCPEPEPPPGDGGLSEDLTDAP
jgi:vancomycin resistance protein YoaR